MLLLRYLQALGKALGDELARDPAVCVFGEDVGESLRGVTKGLREKFGPSRVVDMPLSEQAFTSFATGAALRGRRPVVEFQIPSLLYMAFEQIVNQAQKFSLMTGGQARVPVTYLIPGSGARRGLAGQHSDHPYAFFAHAGVKTIVPATASDAYGLLVTAIRDDDPVALFAPAAVLGLREEIPDQRHAIPLGEARIHRTGSDVTLVATGHLVHDALAVADELDSDVSVEVFDPRTINPFDWERLASSLRKTGRLVVADDTNRTCGVAAEIAATACERMKLVAPPVRITRADATIPFAVELEEELIPSRSQIAAAVSTVMKESS